MASSRTVSNLASTVRGNLITMVRRALLWKCALMMSYNPETVTSAGYPLVPVMHRQCMNPRLSSEVVAASILFATSGVNALTHLVSWATNFANPSYADGIQPRFVHIALGHFAVDMEPLREFRFFLDSIDHHSRIQRQSS